MSDDDKSFAVDVAKNNRASCKKCKQKLEVGVLRLAKLVANPWGSGKLKHYHHVKCMLEAFKTQKATTKKLESTDEIEGWDDLDETNRSTILELTGIANSPSKKEDASKTDNTDSEDNKFRQFIDICEQIAAESSYTGKTNIVQAFFKKGTGKQFQGNLSLWIKMLLPATNPRVYNLKSKQLIKLFSNVFRADQQDMLLDLEQGDIAETITKYFAKSKAAKPLKESKLTMHEVDSLLERLSMLTKEDEQIELLTKCSHQCTCDDLKMFVRLINHDLRITCGAKYILNALHADAYTTFQSSRNLDVVIEKYSSKDQKNSPDKKTKSGATIEIMFPVSPMLAEACKSADQAFKRCPNGMYSEIKYDGERVQVHKNGDEFKYFSRSLKAVAENKVHRLNQFISKAFPDADELILDSEIIMVDTDTGDLLPFGTLGVHKKQQFDSAEVCLFIFDCLYYNGNDLTKKPLSERRLILEKYLNPIKNHIQLSEYNLITTKDQLNQMVSKVLSMGLEGLVLKRIDGPYEPGKRHWLKMKKDYLCEGKMADTADLVVLGGWYGTGKKGGALSVFLMGCYDTKASIWKTVTKCGIGLDDKTLAELNTTLGCLVQRCNSDKPPIWINCKKALLPDMIAVDPQKMPVFEITGAEFSTADSHTSGISIRFPRITRMRSDKSAETATSLQELQKLFENSKFHEDALVKVEKDDIEIKTKMRSPDKKVQVALMKTPVKRKSAVKVEKASPAKKMDRLDIFNDMILYVPDELKKTLHDHVRYFVLWGGSLGDKSNDCTIALHKGDSVAVNLEGLRKQFAPACRHVQQKWLSQCIKDKKLLPFEKFSVKFAKH